MSLKTSKSNAILSGGARAFSRAVAAPQDFFDKLDLEFHFTVATGGFSSEVGDPTPNRRQMRGRMAKIEAYFEPLGKTMHISGFLALSTQNWLHLVFYLCPSCPLRPRCHCALQHILASQ
jgi:hypothetical protein